MASAFACIQAKPVSQELKDKVKRSEEAFRRAHPEATDSELATMVADALEATLSVRQQVILRAVEQQVKLQEVFDARGTLAKKDAIRRYRAVYTGSDTREHGDVTSVIDAWTGNRKILFGHIEPFISQFGRRLGRGRSRDQPTQDLVRRAYSGEQVSSKWANDMGRALRENDEHYVNHLRSKGVPMTHKPGSRFITEVDPAKLRRIGEEEFHADIIDGADLAQMADPDTGAPIFETGPLLSEIYQHAVTNGLSDINPTLPNRIDWWKKLDQTQFFEWKSYDAWKKFNAKYGYDDFYETVMHHTNKMARVMGIVDAMGPDPNASHRMIMGLARETDKPGSTNRADMIQNAWDYMSGSAGRPSSAWLAEAGATVRNGQNLAVLGGLGPLTAAVDPVVASRARYLNGIAGGLRLPQFFAGVASLVASGPRSKRMKQALRQGIELQSIMSSVIHSMRGLGEMGGARAVHSLSDVFYRITGVTAFTDSAQSALGSDIIRTLESVRGLRFAQFPNQPFRPGSSKRLQETLLDFGVSEEDWLRMSANMRFTDLGDGVEGLSLPKMAREGFHDDAVRLMTMVQRIQDQGVIQASAEMRRKMTRGLRPGTLEGEAARAATQLQQFPLTFLWTNVFGRWADTSRGKAGNIASIASLAVAMTLAGAAVTQYRAIGSGKELYEWDDPDFWLRAITIGGGLGLISDLLFREQYGESDMFLFNLMGPTLGTLGQAIALPLQAIPAAVSGQPYNAGREFVNLLRRSVPFANAWIFRPAIDRLFFDTLYEWLDPNAAQLFRSRIRGPARENNQGFWWAPGETVPR